MKTQLQLIVLFFYFGNSCCQIINRHFINDHTNVTCVPNASSCIINCNNGYSCPETIHCPSNSSTDCSCTINCLEQSACRGSTIYSYECATVSIVSKNDYSLAMSDIYAPDSGGSITITSDSGDYGFYQSNVFGAKNTGSITINCYHRLSGQKNGQHECVENTINGIKSNSLVFRCFENAECGDNTIYCPTNSNFQGVVQNTSNCSVVAQSATTYGNSYYATYGSGLVKYMLFCFGIN